MNRLFVTAIAALLIALPAYGMPQYQAYEDERNVGAGHGGTKLTEEGFDYWTNGTPLRIFRMLGVINIPTSSEPSSGAPMGPTDIARLAREYSGDAIIYLNRNKRVTITPLDGKSYASFGNGFGEGFTVPVSEEYRSFAVIAYMTDDEVRASGQAPATNSRRQQCCGGTLALPERKTDNR